MKHVDSCILCCFENRMTLRFVVHEIVRVRTDRILSSICFTWFFFRQSRPTCPRSVSAKAGCSLPPCLASLRPLQWRSRRLPRRPRRQQTSGRPSLRRSSGGRRRSSTGTGFTNISTIFLSFFLIASKLLLTPPGHHLT
jgi:hypothetical protein